MFSFALLADFSFVPLHNPIGFGAVDFIELFIAFLLVALALLWRPFIAPGAAKLSRRTVWCMLLLGLLTYNISEWCACRKQPNLIEYR